MARRIVVTGLGPVTSIGIGKDAFWTGLSEGRNGVRRVDDRIDLEGIDVLIGAPAVDFDPHVFIDPKRARRIDRSSQLALAAARLAVEDASLESPTLESHRVGVRAASAPSSSRG